MLAGGGVGPFAGDAFAGYIAAQAYEHRAASGVPDIADLPIVSDPPPVGEIVTAHRLGLPRRVRYATPSCDMLPHGDERADSAPRLQKLDPASLHPPP